PSRPCVAAQHHIGVLAHALPPMLKRCGMVQRQPGGGRHHDRGRDRRSRSRSLEMSACWHKGAAAPLLYVFGECILDTQRYELCRAGHVSRLRHKVFQVLVYLLAHTDRVVSKQELCEQVWPQQSISEAALESTIKAVRQAIGDSGRGQQLIQTIYGQGYRFLAAVVVHPEAAAGATGTGLLAPLSTLPTLLQAAHDLVPGPSFHTIV